MEFLLPKYSRDVTTHCSKKSFIFVKYYFLMSKGKAVFVQSEKNKGWIFLTKWAKIPVAWPI